jgi:MFS family permease
VASTNPPGDTAGPGGSGSQPDPGPAPFVPIGDSPDVPGAPTASSWGVFHSAAFFRLWMAQVVSSLGGWIGLVAVIALAARVSGGNEAAVGLVMAARLVPGFFFAAVGGVLVDRWDRRRTMVACDIGRAVLISLLPLVDTLGSLFFASFLLELLTLLWSPAKEASVPNLVPADKLPAANSLSLAAAYGTFPIGSAMFASLSGIAAWLGGFDALSALDVNRESLALWFNGVAFLASGLLIMTIKLPQPPPKRTGARRIDWGQTWRELVEGLRFVGGNKLIRSVMLGMGVGLAGCGAVIPLGPIYAKEVLAAGTSGYGLCMTGLGMGAAVGVVALSTVGRRLPTEELFVGAVFATGVGLLLATSMDTLAATVVLTGVFGMGAGAAYVSGFTLAQTHVTDELRGRTFAALYTIIRFCLLLALALAPTLAGILDSVSEALFDDKVIEIGVEVAVPGVRLALWLGGVATMGVAIGISRSVLRSRTPQP